MNLCPLMLRLAPAEVRPAVWKVGLSFREACKAFAKVVTEGDRQFKLTRAQL